MKISLILKSIAPFVVLICGYHLSAVTEDAADDQDQTTYIDLTESTVTPLAFASTTDSGNAVSATTTLGAAGTAWASRQTGSNAELELALSSSDNDGFTVTFSSANDGNFRNTEEDVGHCTGVDGTTAAKDSNCITYVIGCDTISHDATNGQTGIVTYFSNDETPSASEFVKLETDDQDLYRASASATVGGNQSGSAMYRGNVAYLKTGDAELKCDLQFDSDEDIGEVAGSDAEMTYTDTITVTLTEH